MSYIKPFLIGVLIGTFAYALYVEFSPGMGGIWLRPDVNGNKKFRPDSLLGMMIAPLYKPYLWYPQILDINYFVFVGVSGATGVLIKYCVMNCV